MNTDEINDLTERVIGCAMTVSNTLGTGFVEKVYENALCIELQRHGINAQQQVPLKVRYQGIVVGEFSVDVLVEGELLLELKTAKSFDENHQAQLLNYLKATGVKVGLLLNFGTPCLSIKRMML